MPSSHHPQATDVAEQRGVRVVGPEDILFVMRRDPLKLQRLVHYMGELKHTVPLFWLLFIVLLSSDATEVVI